MPYHPEYKENESKVSIWEPTMNLRVLIRRVINGRYQEWVTVGQQQFKNHKGETEWRDIPTVHEE